jgi:pimeloyl-ACP methyl ester carboxylesterase
MLHIEQRGSGTDVVLLHGAPTTPDHMRPLAERLARRCRTLLVHLPGYGSSAGLEPYDLARSHLLLEEALGAAGVTEADFVGLSGGAYRSLAMACRNNVRARSVVGLGAVADFPEDEANGLVEYCKLLRAGVDPRPIVEELMLAPESRKNAAWVEDVRAWGVASPAEHLAQELEAFVAAPDLRPAIAKLEIPILLRVGSLDVATGPARSHRIARVARHATIQEVSGAGHALLCEDFEATAAAIEAHLSATN